MRRSNAARASLAVLLLTVGLGPIPAAAQYGNSPYPSANWQYGLPESWDRIGNVLDAIERPSRRSEVAENWIQFSKSAIAKDLDYRGQWLDLQKRQLNQDQLADQHRLEMARLQMQIEQLRAENLRLERENLELQMTLKNQAAAPEANRSENAHGAAGTKATNERAL